MWFFLSFHLWTWLFSHKAAIIYFGLLNDRDERKQIYIKKYIGPLTLRIQVQSIVCCFHIFPPISVLIMKSVLIIHSSDTFLSSLLIKTQNRRFLAQFDGKIIQKKNRECEHYCILIFYKNDMHRWFHSLDITQGIADCEKLLQKK